MRQAGVARHIQGYHKVMIAKTASFDGFDKHGTGKRTDGADLIYSYIALLPE